MAPRPSLRHGARRPRTQPHRRPLARPAGRHARGLAAGAPWSRDHRPRPCRRVRRRCSPGRARGRPGRRPLAHAAQPRRRRPRPRRPARRRGAPGRPTRGGGLGRAADGSTAASARRAPAHGSRAGQGRVVRPQAGALRGGGPPARAGRLHPAHRGPPRRRACDRTRLAVPRRRRHLDEAEARQRAGSVRARAGAALGGGLPQRDPAVERGGRGRLPRPAPAPSARGPRNTGQRSPKASAAAAPPPWPCRPRRPRAGVSGAG